MIYSLTFSFAEAFVRAVKDVLEEVPALHLLHHDEDHVGVLEDVHHLDDPGVIERPQDVYLIPQSASSFR